MGPWSTCKRSQARCASVADEGRKSVAVDLAACRDSKEESKMPASTLILPQRHVNGREGKGASRRRDPVLASTACSCFEARSGRSGSDILQQVKGLDCACDRASNVRKDQSLCNNSLHQCVCIHITRRLSCYGRCLIDNFACNHPMIREHVSRYWRYFCHGKPLVFVTHRNLPSSH